MTCNAALSLCLLALWLTPACALTSPLDDVKSDKDGGDDTAGSGKAGTGGKAGSGGGKAGTGGKAGSSGSAGSGSAGTGGKMDPASAITGSCDTADAGVCEGEDAYTACIKDACASDFKKCFGANYESGDSSGGACDSLFDCVNTATDPCNNDCKADSTCTSCLTTLVTCVSGSTCVEPVCPDAGGVVGTDAGSSCVPDCTTNASECGDDGCGGSCGSCTSPQSCYTSQCLYPNGTTTPCSCDSTTYTAGQVIDEPECQEGTATFDICVLQDGVTSAPCVDQYGNPTGGYQWSERCITKASGGR